MEVQEYALKGGGRMKHRRYKSRSGSVDVYALVSSDGKEKYVSKDKAKSMLSCDPNDPNGRTQLVIKPDGRGMCVVPNVEREIEKLRKKKDAENAKAVKKYLAMNNLTDLVSPYMADPVQKSILSYILGRKNVNEIEMLNALVYSGIINTKCPPPGEEHKTEEYINILTGKTECREPIPAREAITDADISCPQLDGDPYAIEKYIDFFGEAKCRRPVLSGAFTCPPAGNPKKTQHVTLANGTGVCVEDSRFKKDSDKFILPTNLVYPDEINTRIVEFLRMYVDNRFTSEQVHHLASLFRNAKTLGDLKRGLSNDAYYEEIVAIVSNMKSDDDIGIAKSALLQYAKGMGQVGESGESAIEFMGLHPDVFKKTSSIGY